MGLGLRRVAEDVNPLRLGQRGNSQVDVEPLAGDQAVDVIAAGLGELVKQLVEPQSRLPRDQREDGRGSMLADR
jgi:hypothetical protein